VRRINNPASSPPGATSNSLLVFRKTAGASEPSAYAWTLKEPPVSVYAVGGIQCFLGVNTADPIDVEAGQATPSGLNHSTPSVTTTVANTMLVTSHTFSSSLHWNAPLDMTEHIDTRTTTVPLGATGQTIEANFADKPAAGVTGSKIATATGGQSGDADVGNTHILALRPASPPTLVFRSGYESSTAIGNVDPANCWPGEAPPTVLPKVAGKTSLALTTASAPLWVLGRLTFGAGTASFCCSLMCRG
jgi:hypothetical protein